ncbi:TIGR03013 family PEP-CTERM/XrtA system glycosyltransferase [Desulfococcaceae bacterium HSG8]|nr:TIGR03013 family PEP-CTERM/XrtA system glycosyltransferase [Desulfococcaceae bacterium HSG8]
MLTVLKQYYPIRNLFFIFGEGLIIYASVLVADRIIFNAGFFVINYWLCLKALLITFVCQICLYYNDLYDLNLTYRLPELGIRLLQSLGVATILLSGIYFIFPSATIGSSIFFGLTIVFSTLFIVFWRFLCTLILKSGIFNRRIIILGSGELARNITDEISYRKNCGYVVTAIAAESPADADTFGETDSGVFYRERHNGLCEIAKDMGVRRIVVALKERKGGFPAKELLNCRVNGIDVLEGDTFYEMLTGKLSVEHINPEWLIFSEGFRKSFLIRFMKRSTDIVLSFAMLLALLPLIIITAVIIRIDSRGPVFFSQERVGERRKIYKIYKFRSMVADAEKRSGPVWAKQNDVRVTRIGKFIRKWRIDEIPQLWNVLKGEMSFVGPRPEREFFVKGLEYIIPYYGARFTAKPGLTGWAQVCYGYGASVKDATEKLNYDLFYMKNMSIFMDLIIVLRTVKTVISGEGAR